MVQDLFKMKIIYFLIPLTVLADSGSTNTANEKITGKCKTLTSKSSDGTVPYHQTQV